MGQSGTLRFTVNLVELMKDTAEYLVHTRANTAAGGVIYRMHVAVAHLQALANAVVENGCDPEAVLRLFALGLVENPIDLCAEAGTWEGRYEELARRLGAL